MLSGVHIAGMGVISAIGNNVQQNLQSLLGKQHGIAHMQYLESVHADELPVGEVKQSNQELAALCGLPETVSRTALLSAVAATEALNNGGIELAAWRAGFISANSVGGMDKTENFFAAFLKDNADGRLRDVVHHECGAITQLVADKLGIRHFVSTVSTACSSSANSIFLAARLIKQNILDVAIAGGVDALTRFTLNGFNTLMILDQDLCKPFDENRKGLNLGEGAAYLVLVSDKVMNELQLKPFAKLTGWCNANDAYHQTASSPEGIGSFKAMEGALKKSGLKPTDIGYINLHGTGTQNNDIAEGTAVGRLFGNDVPYCSSTKAFTGHTLGASGAIEAVFSVLALQHGIIYPNLRLQTPMKDLNFQPVTELKRQHIKHVLSNSFGFGGNCSSLIFSSTDY